MPEVWTSQEPRALKPCWWQTPPPLLARIVFAESEGNPFLIEEVFRHLAEERELFDANP
jgi:hypothetical protein